MVIINALQSVFTIVIMIVIGYVLTWKGWIDDNTSKVFSKLVINISLPALMLSNLMTTFTKDKLSQAGIGLIIPFISMVICYAIGLIVSKLIKVKVSRKGTFLCMFFLSNTIFIGLPLNISLFGDHSVPYVLYYYISNTTIFWTIGVYAIKQDSGEKVSGIFTLDTFKKIFTPPLMGFIVAILLILLQIELPVSIMDTCKYIGSLTTPLSMFFIGSVIYSLDLSDIKPDLDMFFVLFGRFIISPVITVGIALYFKAPTLMKDVFVIQSALPVMANIAITSKEYDADYKFAASMIAITTLLSMLFIPIYMFLLK